MKDPFVTDSGIDSPTRESFRNIEGCYNRNIFKGKSFANSRRALQSGAEKISRTFKSVRNTFGNLSQVIFFGMTNTCIKIYFSLIIFCFPNNFQILFIEMIVTFIYKFSFIYILIVLYVAFQAWWPTQTSINGSQLTVQSGTNNTCD